MKKDIQITMKRYHAWENHGILPLSQHEDGDWVRYKEAEEKISNLQEELDHHAHMVLKLENKLVAVRNANKINCLQIEKLNDEIELAWSGFASADKERTAIRAEVDRLREYINKIRKACCLAKDRSLRGCAGEECPGNIAARALE